LEVANGMTSYQCNRSLKAIGSSGDTLLFSTGWLGATGEAESERSGLGEAEVLLVKDRERTCLKSGSDDWRCSRSGGLPFRGASGPFTGILSGEPPPPGKLPLYRAATRFDEWGSYLSEWQGAPCRMYYTRTGGSEGDATEITAEMIVRVCFDQDTYLPLSRETIRSSRRASPDDASIMVFAPTDVDECTYFGIDQPLEIEMPEGGD
jgi:hypothetical protein